MKAELLLIHLKTQNIVFFQLLFHIQQSMTRNFYMIVISTNQSFISQIWRIVRPLGKSLIFLVPWDLKFKEVLITKPRNSSSDR